MRLASRSSHGVASEADVCMTKNVPQSCWESIGNNI
jgi:hypothetical protein